MPYGGLGLGGAVCVPFTSRTLVRRRSRSGAARACSGRRGRGLLPARVGLRLCLRDTRPHSSLGNLTLPRKAQGLQRGRIFQVSPAVFPPGQSPVPAGAPTGRAVRRSLRSRGRRALPVSRRSPGPPLSDSCPRLAFPPASNTLAFRHLQSRKTMIKFLRRMCIFIFMTQKKSC